MSAAEVNIPLLRKAVEWAEAEAAKPWEISEWNQTAWETAPENVVQIDRETWTPISGAKKSPECGTCYCVAGFIVKSEGASSRRSGWSRPAADLLGIDLNTADELFDAANSIEDIRRIAESIAGERL